MRSYSVMLSIKLDECPKQFTQLPIFTGGKCGAADDSQQQQQHRGEGEGDAEHSLAKANPAPPTAAKIMPPLYGVERSSVGVLHYQGINHEASIRSGQAREPARQERQRTLPVKNRPIMTPPRVVMPPSHHDAPVWSLVWSCACVPLSGSG